MSFDNKTTTRPSNHYLNTSEAANFLNVSRQFLEQDRVTARHRVPYYKFGKAVRYKLNELAQWAESRRQY